MKQCVWCVLVALSLGGFPVFAQGSGEEKIAKMRFGIEVRGTLWGVPNYMSQITNVPVALRQIPGHKDDFPGGGVTIVVPDASINPQRFVNLAVAAAPGITLGERVSLRLGAHWGIPFAQRAEPKNEGNTREVNLEGTPERGVGRSLVYYSAQYSAGHHPGFFGEVEARASNRYSILAGYLINYYNVTIERGWDRFNALERSDRRRLASAQMHAPYLGFRIFSDARRSQWSGVMFFAGLAFSRLSPTTLGASAKIEVSKPGIVLGLSFGKTFRFGEEKGD
jgi:hypothetical protein